MSADVRTAVLDAENTFSECWSVLAKMEEGNSAAPEYVKGLRSFQWKLARALFRLERKYDELAKRARSLIERKADLNTVWFVRRMVSTTCNSF